MKEPSSAVPCRSGPKPRRTASARWFEKPTLPPLLRSRPLILLPFGGAEDHGPWIFTDQQHFRSLVDQDKIEMGLSEDVADYGRRAGAVRVRSRSSGKRLDGDRAVRAGCILSGGGPRSVGGGGPHLRTWYAESRV